MRLFLICAFAFIAMTSFARAEETIAKTWKVCQTTADCVVAQLDKNCARAAVNKTHRDEALAVLSKETGQPQPGMDGRVRCLNAPEALCENNLCTLMVHPE